ncbi:MAG: hypothetical protein ACXU8S_06505 [Phenylobacterium sp.]
MRKALSAALAALTLGGAVTATVATSADARPYYGGHYYGHRGNGAGIAVAGIAGLALGAALASDHPHYYRGGYYAPGPYAYGYGPGYYGTCYATRWVWDPYYGRRVPVREAYAC